jgi:anti-sigma regulatory factor (Ser/Thr protein kinase)
MSNQEISLVIPAAHRYLNIISAVIAELLAREERLSEPAITSYNIQLAAQEVCANIVDHAYVGHAGQIELLLRLEAEPHQLVIELTDNGLPFDPTGVSAPDLDELHENGYGLFLARELLDELGYERRQDTNYWRLIKRLA